MVHNPHLLALNAKKWYSLSGFDLFQDSWRIMRFQQVQDLAARSPAAFSPFSRWPLKRATLIPVEAAVRSCYDWHEC